MSSPQITMLLKDYANAYRTHLNDLLYEIREIENSIEELLRRDVPKVKKTLGILQPKTLQFHELYLAIKNRSGGAWSVTDHHYSAYKELSKLLVELDYKYRNKYELEYVLERYCLQNCDSKTTITFSPTWDDRRIFKSGLD